MKNRGKRLLAFRSWIFQGSSRALAIKYILPIEGIEIRIYINHMS